MCFIILEGWSTINFIMLGREQGLSDTNKIPIFHYINCTKIMKLLTYWDILKWYIPTEQLCITDCHVTL
jgi:hypothetical protein